MDTLLTIAAIFFFGFLCYRQGQQSAYERAWRDVMDKTSKTISRIEKMYDKRGKL